MEKNTPSYWTVLPANIRYDKRLSADEKIMWSEIVSLCNMDGKCFANNMYFAKLYDVSKVTISKRVNKLVSLGYIKSKIVYREGTQEVLRRYLSIIDYPIKEILNTPIQENLTDNNTNFNTTILIEIKGYSFTEFWNDYDKKVGDKEKVKKKFEKLSEKVRAEIQVHIPLYIEAQPDKKFRKNPDTFINQKGWTHEIIQSNGNEKNGGGSRLESFIS